MRSGTLEAAEWFPEGCYPPSLPFIGDLAPRRPPSPPTRRIMVLESDLSGGGVYTSSLNCP